MHRKLYRTSCECTRISNARVPCVTKLTFLLNCKKIYIRFEASTLVHVHKAD